MALLDEKNSAELDLDRLFALSRLSLPTSEQEREEMRLSLTAAADYIYPLLNQEAECDLPFSVSEAIPLCDLRDDIPTGSNDCGEQLLALSPEAKNGYFLVPRVIEEEKK